MPIKDMFRKLTVPVTELDTQSLRDFCSGQPGCSSIAEAAPRQQVSLVGEIRTLRIVPHDGSPFLEATISDGTGSMVVVWTGRRRIAGVAPAKRLRISGRGAPIGPGGRLLFYNPRYELL